MLDTHAWIWWASDPAKLSKRARTVIEEAPGRFVSAISAWEIAMLVVANRLRLDDTTAGWVRRCEGAGLVEIVPIDAGIAVRAAELQEAGFHRDPADRVIYATARQLDLRLVTKDDRIRMFDRRATVW